MVKTCPRQIQDRASQLPAPRSYTEDTRRLSYQHACRTTTPTPRAALSKSRKLVMRRTVICQSDSAKHPNAPTQLDGSTWREMLTLSRMGPTTSRPPRRKFAETNCISGWQFMPGLLQLACRSSPRAALLLLAANGFSNYRLPTPTVPPPPCYPRGHQRTRVALVMQVTCIFLLVSVILLFVCTSSVRSRPQFRRRS